jgi:hypothetical protein
LFTIKIPYFQREAEILSKIGVECLYHLICLVDLITSPVSKQEIVNNQYTDVYGQKYVSIRHEINPTDISTECLPVQSRSNLVIGVFNHFVDVFHV